MGRGRVLLLIACALGLGTVALVAPAGATPLLGSSPNRYVSPTHRQVCASAPAHFSSCLAQVVVPETTSGTNAGGGGASRGQTASPQNTSPTGLPPKAITTAYGFPTTGGDGKTIAVVDAYDDPTIASQPDRLLEPVRLAAMHGDKRLLHQGQPDRRDNLTRASHPGWGLEISLDVEWAHALAPKAHILLVEASSSSDTNLFAAVTYAAQHAQYVSMSWGGTEYTGETNFDGDFLAAPNVSFFAASGDSATAVVYPVGLSRRDLGRRDHPHNHKVDLRLEGRDGVVHSAEGAAAPSRSPPPHRRPSPPTTRPGPTCDGTEAIPDVALDGNPNTGSLRLRHEGAQHRAGGLAPGRRHQRVDRAVGRPLGRGRGPRHLHIRLRRQHPLLRRHVRAATGSTCEKGYNLCTGLGSWNQSQRHLECHAGFRVGTAGHRRRHAVGSYDGDPQRTRTLGGAYPSPSPPTRRRAASRRRRPGPSLHSLSVVIPSGSTSSPSFYYQDTKAGSPVLTASASYVSSVTQTETVRAVPWPGSPSRCQRRHCSRAQANRSSPVDSISTQIRSRPASHPHGRRRVGARSCRPRVPPRRSPRRPARRRETLIGEPDGRADHHSGDGQGDVPAVGTGEQQDLDERLLRRPERQPPEPVVAGEQRLARPSPGDGCSGVALGGAERTDMDGRVLCEHVRGT